MTKISEYRGVEGLVYAKVLQDDADGFLTSTPKSLAGVAEISRTTESSNEAHYYDNIPAVVISSTGSDEVSINTSAIPFDVLADITGQTYDQDTGMFIEQERTPGYYAIGYQTKKTDGTIIFVWRLKGTFNIPGQTNATENDGTDANGQELTFTGISTTHKFTKTGKGAKAINVDTSVNTSVTAADFFSAVQTPDTVGAGTYSVTGIGVIPSTASIEVDETITLAATLFPTGATGNITWSSSSDSIAIVDEYGVVTGIAAGTATITATCGDYSDTCTVTVTDSEE